jgi:hypothetical protein
MYISQKYFPEKIKDIDDKTGPNPADKKRTCRQDQEVAGDKRDNATGDDPHG